MNVFFGSVLSFYQIQLIHQPKFTHRQFQVHCILIKITRTQQIWMIVRQGADRRKKKDTNLAVRKPKHFSHCKSTLVLLLLSLFVLCAKQINYIFKKIRGWGDFCFSFIAKGTIRFHSNFQTMRLRVSAWWQRLPTPPLHWCWHIMMRKSYPPRYSCSFSTRTSCRFVVESIVTDA